MASQSIAESSAVDIVLKLDSAGRAFINTRQAEVVLNCSTKTLYNYMSSGRLPYAHIGNRTMLAVEDIARLVAELRAEGPPKRTVPWDEGGQMPRKRWPRRALESVQ